MDDPEVVAVAILTRSGLPRGPLRVPDIVGDANHAYVCGRSVVRFARDGRRSDFALEEWCARRAAELGVPVAETVAVGALDGVEYMVQEFVPDTARNSTSIESLWRTLGEYARALRDVPLDSDSPSGLYSRFGRNLPEAWRAHLDYNLAALEESDPLVELGVYHPADRQRLRAVIRDLADTEVDFGLSHGDLSPRNLRVGDGRRPVLIDWGSASAGPVPFTDLLHLHRFHDDTGVPSSGDLAAFADGLGQDLRSGDDLVQRVRLVAALDLVRWALDTEPGRLEEMVDAARPLMRAERLR